jgi:rod shape-determining protein MreC
MRITPRRWFWLLNVTAIVCVFLGARQTSALESACTFARSSVEWVLMPVSWTCSNLQFVLNRALHPQPDSQSALDKLRIHDSYELALLLHQIVVLQHELSETQHIHADFPGISAAQLRLANIEGFSSGSVDQCVLDQGWRDDARIKQGSPVMADLAVVGVVDSIGADTCTVRLLSDPRMQEGAAIIRQTPDGQLPVCSQGVLMQGSGGGKMYCDLALSTGALAPRAGDLVVLNDNEWPPVVNGAVIGVIDSTQPSDQNSLHLILNIRPPIDMQQTHQAAIVLPVQ